MSTTDLLRVTKIRVEKLFDRYTHEVQLRLRDRVTIIHGPNGVGKTVLLRLTAALLSGRLVEFAKIPFEIFEVSLSDGSVFGARRSDDQKNNQNPLPSFYLRPASGKGEIFHIKAEYADIVRLARRIEGETPLLLRVGPDQFSDRRTGETLSAFDVIFRYPELIPERLRKEGLFGEPEWLQGIRSRVGIHLIEAQRLMRFVVEREPEYRAYYAHAVYAGPTPPQYVETVKDYARDLQQRISEALTSYARESQSLDQSFPERLLSASVWGGFSVEDLKVRMQQLEQKRAQLKRIGLIGEDAAYPFDVAALEKVNDAQRSVMTLYVDDTAKKLGALDDLARRIEIMLENINRKFQHKAIQISKEKGFTAVTAEGKQLELASLSSGEQHELVLLYDLLFRVKANTLVLIDEPELSLHVTWQKSFLPDLLQIVGATNFDVLLATHSPFIVGDRDDLMVELRVDERKS